MSDESKFVQWAAEHWQQLVAFTTAVFGAGAWHRSNDARIKRFERVIPEKVLDGKAHLQTNEDVKECQKELTDQFSQALDDHKTAMDKMVARVDDIYKLLLELKR